MFATLSVGLGVLQWLATPIIALAGVMIALQQQRLADIKLRNDVFDRRFKIFEAAKKLMTYRLSDLPPNYNFIKEFELDTTAAPFFFDDKISNYLTELRHNVERLDQLYFMVIDHGDGKDISSATREMEATRKWLLNEYNTIVAKFSPSMALKPSIRRL